MPSRSPKQARTMRAAAHDPAFAKRIGIPQKVAREFVQADTASVGHAKRVTDEGLARDHELDLTQQIIEGGWR